MTSYFTDLFTPETWEAFRKHGATVSGFRDRQRKTAERIKPGDRLLCYLVRLSRWCGVLEVLSGPYIDSSPIFSDPDPFVVRFAVRPEVLLELDRSIPIFEQSIWSELSLTRDMQVRSFGWAQQAKLRSSLMALSMADGELLTAALLRQAENQNEHPLTAQDYARLGRKHSVRTVDREVIVEVPEKVENSELSAPNDEFRESHRVQATLARIGAEMDFRIWVPRSDRQKILDQLPTGSHGAFLDALPLNYDDTTLKTIEQIDVIWLKGRSMARALRASQNG